MMTSRLAGALVAGTLGVGILIGAAGMIVVREAPSPAALDVNAHMTQTSRMGSMMVGGSAMMSGRGAMMPGQGGMMSGQDDIGPMWSAMPEWMRARGLIEPPDSTR